jgi:hypothetical protein
MQAIDDAGLCYISRAHHAVVCYRRFPERVRKAPNWRDPCDGSFSETASLQSAGAFCAFFSGSEIPFPGNGDRKRQRLGSNAGYAEGSPSMWCCRDHPLAVRAQNLIYDFDFTLHSLDPAPRGHLGIAYRTNYSVAVRFNRRPAWLPAL